MIKIFKVNTSSGIGEGLDLYSQDGGYAEIHFLEDPGHFETIYYQSRWDPEFISNDDDIRYQGWEKLSAGKMYVRPWTPKHKEVDQEMLLDAARWLHIGETKFEFIKAKNFDEISQAVKEYNLTISAIYKDKV